MTDTPDPLPERVVVSRACQTERKLHLPDGDGNALCTRLDNPDRGTQCKPLACYPPSHRSWCQYCLERQHLRARVSPAHGGGQALE